MPTARGPSTLLWGRFIRFQLARKSTLNLAAISFGKKFTTSGIQARGLIGRRAPLLRRRRRGQLLAADRIVGHDSGVTWRAIRQGVHQPAESVLWQWSSAKTAE